MRGLYCTHEGSECLPHLTPLVHLVGQLEAPNLGLLDVQQEDDRARDCGIQVAVLALLAQ